MKQSLLLYTAGAKRGKMRASKVRLIEVWISSPWLTNYREFWQLITEAIKTKSKLLTLTENQLSPNTHATFSRGSATLTSRYFRISTSSLTRSYSNLLNHSRTLQTCYKTLRLCHPPYLPWTVIGLRRLNFALKIYMYYKKGTKSIKQTRPETSDNSIPSY